MLTCKHCIKFECETGCELAGQPDALLCLFLVFTFWLISNTLSALLKLIRENCHLLLYQRSARCFDTLCSSKNYHKQSKHENNLYLCDQCEFKTHAKCNLKQHVKEQHLKISFSCTQCSYQSTRKEYLRQHVRRDHEGLYYYCDQCNFKTSRNSQLTKHIKCKHDSWDNKQ